MRGLWVVLAALLTFPIGATAQSPTPAPGFIDAAERTFEAAGLKLIGTAYLRSGAYRFDSETAAALGLQSVTEGLTKNVDDTGGSLQPASSPQFGDETVALAGTAASPEQPDTKLVVGIVAWRDGTNVLLIYGVAYAGDPLGDVLGVARKIEGRESEGDTQPLPIEEGDVPTSGAWSLVATLADVPEGLIITDQQPFFPARSATATPAG